VVLVKRRREELRKSVREERELRDIECFVYAADSKISMFCDVRETIISSDVAADPRCGFLGAASTPKRTALLDFVQRKLGLSKCLSTMITLLQAVSGSFRL